MPLASRSSVRVSGAAGLGGRSQRAVVALGVLAVVWAVTYWLWDPGTPGGLALAGDQPTITIDTDRPASERPNPGESGPDGLGPVIISTGPAVRPETGPVRRPANTTETPPEPQPATGVVAPAFRDYVVREGDSFERIAKRELGDARLWVKIAESNPLKDPRRIKPGDVLRLPIDPSNTQGRPATGSPAPADDGDDTDDTMDGVIVYTVKAGDTLSGIATQYYGSAGFAEFIYFHNRGVLASMNDLRPGQRLELPPAGL